MTPLLLAALALLAAPLVDPLLRRRPPVEGFTNGAIQVFIGGVMLVHVLPFGLVTAGWPAALALAAGGGLGLATHRVPGGERGAGFLAVLALLLHCVIDGAALAIPDGGHADDVVAWAVVLHSFPVGVAVWRISTARGGPRLAVGLLGASVIATAAGWHWAGRIVEGASAAGLGLLQCLVAGALLHVLGHLGENGPRRSNGWGALLGAVGVVALALHHPVPQLLAGEINGRETVTYLFVEVAPALVIGYLAAGLLHAFAPAALPRWLKGRTVLGSAARGALVGLPVPVCSCGALPLYRGLLARGVPPAAGLAFLVAGPEVGIGTLLVSIPLLGAHLTLLRLVAAFALALAIGVFVGPLIPPQRTRAAIPEERPALRARVSEGLHFGLVETVEHTAPWVLAGLLIAGLIEPILSADFLHRVPGPLGVVAAAVAGLLSYVCASGATPFVAVLMHKGLSGGAAIAFLLTGPATNISTFGVLRRLHGKRVAIRFATVAGTLAIGLGLVTDAIWPALTLPPLHAAVAHDHGLAEVICAGLVVVLFAAALVRGGVAGFLDPILHPNHDHDHQPGEECGHDHGHTHEHGAACPGPVSVLAPPVRRAGSPVLKLDGIRFVAAPGPRAVAGGVGPASTSSQATTGTTSGVVEVGADHREPPKHR